MPVYKFQPGRPPRTTLGGVFAGILGLGLAALTFFVGIFVAIGLLIAGALLALGLRVRLWWLGRSGGAGIPGAGRYPDGNGAVGSHSRRASRPSGEVLEGEYEEVKPPSNHP